MIAAAPIAEIDHGPGWGNVKVGAAEAFVSVKRRGTSGRPVVVILDDGDGASILMISKAALSALSAAIVAARCPHHPTEGIDHASQSG